MSEPLRETLRPDMPPAFEFLGKPPLGSVRYRVAYGGRGGAKSWSVARVLLIHGAQRKLRILCSREYQSSIRDSVHRLLSDQIADLGLEHFYTIEQTRIYGRNGTEILFYGLKRDVHSIKSLEGVDLCWVEEAEAITKESLEVLIPTIRSEGSEIWFTFNPKLPDDPIYKRFVDDPPATAIVRKVGLEDNPWASQTLKDERAEMLRRDPEAEAHIWGGEPWTRSDAQVMGGLYRVAEFEPEEHWGDPLFGADWGFSQDPTTLLKMWIHDRRLYIRNEVRGIGWSMDEINRRFRRISGAEDHTIRGDCSRPETINELRQRGLKVTAAKKWPGSVEDGIEHFRGYEEIIIHPECKGIIQDARLWRYKTDTRTGDVLPKLIDGNDHGWDAARYALAPIIRSRPSWGVLT